MSGLQTQINRAVGVATQFMQDSVTFSRPAITIDSSGGHGRTITSTSPASVPCSYRPARPNEREKLAGEKPIKGTLYALFVPSQTGSDFIDVDASCLAVVAARDGFSAKTFTIEAIQRAPGVIKILASSTE
jgi:hypothetical protein